MPLPHVLICGFMKASTTALRNNLAAHPAVFAYPKEIGFFSNRDLYEKGLSYYSSLFEEAQRGQLIVEKSPWYATEPAAMARIERDLPSVKLAFVLRNPTDRAYSHWRHAQRKEHEAWAQPYLSLSFDECVERALAGEEPFTALLHGSYYARHLTRPLKAVGRNRMFVAYQEELDSARGGRVLRDFQIWCGLKPQKLPNTKYHASKNDVAPMSLETRARLEQHFRKPNRELAYLLGVGHMVSWALDAAST